MDYLAAMRAFVRSVDLGSLSKAASENGAKLSTVSRHITALEADLGAALLNRSTRSLHLTEAGTAFYQHAVTILAAVEEARQATSALNSRPRGLLQVELPSAFARAQVLPRLATLLERHPEMRVSATLVEEPLPLVESGMDVAVRLGILPASGLVAKRLAAYASVLCVAPSALDRRLPRVAHPEDLAGVECIGESPASRADDERWFYQREDGDEVGSVVIRGRFRCNDPAGALGAALSGLGYVVLPRWLVESELVAGRLLRVLPRWRWSSRAPALETVVWAVYAPKKVVSPKVRSFIDFLRHELAADPLFARVP